MIQEIRTRRSIRKYKNQPVENDKVMQLIESARLAPSGSNTQPWHFIIIRTKEMREKLAKASHNQKWMMTAPVFIACVADIRSRIEKEEPIHIDEHSPLPEVKQIIRDTTIAIEHMVLEAESLGLGTCYVAWFEQDDIRPILGIPEDKYLLCILTIGYADETPEARPRKKPENIIHEEKW